MYLVRLEQNLDVKRWKVLSGYLSFGYLVVWLSGGLSGCHGLVDCLFFFGASRARAKGANRTTLKRRPNRIRCLAYLVVWLSGCLVVWLSGCLNIWSFGSLAVRLFGCLDVWLRPISVQPQDSEISEGSQY